MKITKVSEKNHTLVVEIKDEADIVIELNPIHLEFHSDISHIGQERKEVFNKVISILTEKGVKISGSTKYKRKINAITDKWVNSIQTHVATNVEGEVGKKQMAYLDEVIPIFNKYAKYNDGKFTEDILLSNVLDSDGVTLMGRSKTQAGKEQIASKVAHYTRIESRFEDDSLGKVNENLYGNIMKILNAISDLQTTGVVSFNSEEMIFSELISDHIEGLMSTTPFYELSERKAIYSFWEERFNEHDELLKSADKLIKWARESEAFDEKAIDSFDDAVDDIRENNYVIEAKPINVMDTKEEEMALQLIGSFLRRYKEEAGASEAFSGVGAINEHTQYDPLTALYIDSFFGGAFFDGDVEQMENVKMILDDYDSIISEFGLEEKFKEMKENLPHIKGPIKHSKSTKKITNVLELDIQERLAEQEEILAEQRQLPYGPLPKEKERREVKDPVNLQSSTRPKSSPSNITYYNFGDDLEDIEDIVNAINTKQITSKLYVPSLLFSAEYLDKHYANLDKNPYDNIDTSDHQEIYTTLIKKTVALIVEGQTIKRQGRIAGKGAPKASNEGDRLSYNASWTGQRTEFTTPSDTQMSFLEPTVDAKGNKILTPEKGGKIHGADTLYDFLEVLKRYLLTPHTTSLGLGIKFHFKDSQEYGSLLNFAAKENLLENEGELSKVNLNLLTRGMLDEQYSNQGSNLFSGKALTTIKSFLEELNGAFNFEELQKKASNLITAMIKSMTSRQTELDRETVKKIKQNIRKEIHSFIQHIAEKIGEELISPFDRKIEVDEITNLRDISTFAILQEFMVANKDTLKATRGTYDEIVKLIDIISEDNLGNVKSREDNKTINKKLLEAHDGIRIIKGWPIHYGLKSIYSIEGINNMKDELGTYYGVDLTAMDISKIVEEVDSYSNIAKQNGISEDKVYLIKANFR